MKQRRFHIGLASCLLGGSMLAAAMQPADAAALLTLQKLIAIPASTDNNLGGKFVTYDISDYDPTTGLIYIADRSNAAVDIFSTLTDSYVGRIGGSGQLFVGQGPGVANANSGPDGVQVVNSATQHSLYVGNGNATVVAFDLSNPNPTSTAKVITVGSASTDRRADEMAYSSATHTLIVANNAADVPFISIIDTTTNTVTHKVSFDGTNGTPNAVAGGIEASAYNAGLNKFFISIPQIGDSASDPGGISELDPTTGAVLKTYSLAAFGFSSCSPAGLVQGLGNQLLIACGNASQSIIFDPTANGGNGKVIASFTQASGTDEAWFDPALNEFFLAARNNPGGPVLGVIDAVSDTFVQNIATTAGDHSVASGNGQVFVAFGSGNAACPLGCEAVFGVPEPSAAPLFAVAGTALGAIFWRRRRRA